MDIHDDGADRHTGEESFPGGAGEASGSVIRPEIAWRGPEGHGVVAARVASFAQPKARTKAEPECDSGSEVAIVGSSPQAKEIREKIRLYAAERAPVLVTGETGVGKERISRELHRLSNRAHKPFKPVNSGGLQDGLAADEFFGHAKGAFTGAISDRDGAFLAADGGVLFLDEIGLLAPTLQAYLLRVLDDGVVNKLGAKTPVKVDIRLICATNVDLRQGVAEGLFRSDLYYRINVLQIHAPPLRERGDDVIEIAEDIIRNDSMIERRKTKLTPKAADYLRTREFRGNIRELQNLITRALVHASDGKIFEEDVIAADDSADTVPTDVSLDLGEAKDLIEKCVALKALMRTGGNVSQAAALTKRTRSTFYAIMKQLNGDDLASEYQKLRTRIGSMLDAS